MGVLETQESLKSFFIFASIINQKIISIQFISSTGEPILSEVVIMKMLLSQLLTKFN